MTRDKVLLWVGNENPIEDLADTITQLLNQEYTIQDLREDIIDFQEQEIQYWSKI